MITFSVKDFDRESFPALYQRADTCSKSSQSCYLNWMAANLSLLVIGATIGSFSLEDLGHKRTAYVVMAVLFFVATAVSILLATRRWERIWYAGRAVAESAKSLTWKFVCGAEPFPIKLDVKEAVLHFTNTLRELLQENRQLAALLPNEADANEEVTDFMLRMRNAPVGVARDAYLSQRVNEQQSWYFKKAAANRKNRNTWFSLLVFFQVSAGLGAVALAIYPEFQWRAATMFSTLASATVAWGQVRRYQELAQAYGLAAQELSFIATRGAFVQTREEFARFVNDAETAISREHSMWVARRETK